MLNNYFNKLQQSIQWAEQQDDIDVLCLARDSMTQLLDFVNTLPLSEQFQAQQTIDQVLPMEWPLWMEACRYEDGDQGCQQTLH
jgi:hypothetical protein